MGILSGDSDFFGLDIGMTAIRVVQLSGKHPSRTVFRYGQLVHDRRLTEKDDEASLSQLAEVIRETLVRHQITTRNVVVGLPTSRVFATVRQFDSLSPSDLEKSLKFQMDTIIPQSIDSVQVDWALLDKGVQQPQTADGKPAKQDVFVCSADKNYLQQRLEMLEAINLNVMVFEPDALALLRTATNKSQEASLLIDVGHTTSDIVAVARNAPRLVTSVASGIHHVLRAVVNSLGISEEQAQELIYRIGLKGDHSQSALISAIEHGLEGIVVQLRKVADNFSQRYSQQYQLAHVMVWGDIIYIPGAIDHLSQQMNMLVIGGDSWQNVAAPESMQTELQSVSASFAVAVGLAERRFS